MYKHFPEIYDSAYRSISKMEGSACSSSQQAVNVYQLIFKVVSELKNLEDNFSWPSTQDETSYYKNQWLDLNHIYYYNLELSLILNMPFGTKKIKNKHLSYCKKRLGLFFFKV